MPRTTQKKPYHHGDLRPALLRAVKELLAEQGIESLSLRECARRAGVSWSAPGHHFGDKTGMLTAFATDGYVALASLMQKRSRQQSEPRKAAAAVGNAYLEFALKEPEYFRVMFRTELLNQTEDAYKIAKASAFAVLDSSLRLCRQAEGLTNDSQSLERCLLAWSAVHGFATLLLEGAIKEAGRTPKARLKRGMELGQQVLRLLGPALFSDSRKRQQ